jgi:hypothetical protein
VAFERPGDSLRKTVEPERVARVFISFVHEDQQVAMAVQALIARELDLRDEVFLSADRRQVFGGDIWLDKIRAALEQCEVLVLMLSRRSLRRSWVNFEAGAVWLSRRPVIPVCFGKASKHHLNPPYASMQALDLPNDAGYLIESIYHHLRLKSPPPVSPYLTGLVLAGPGQDQDPKWLERMRPYNRVESVLNVFVDDD